MTFSKTIERASFCILIALGSLVGLSGPINAAMDFQDSRNSFGGGAYLDGHHGSHSEDYGIDTLHNHLRMRGQGSWRRTMLPDHTGIVILESFGSRRRPAREFVAFDFYDGGPASGPILRLDDPFSGVKIRRLDDSFGPVASVPLPPSLPVHILGLLAIGVLGRRKNRARTGKSDEVRR